MLLVRDIRLPLSAGAGEAFARALKTARIPAGRAAQLGVARLSFAGEEAMRMLLRTVPGSVSPLELLFDTEMRVRLLVDEELRAAPVFCGHPGLSTSTVRLGSDDLRRYLASTGHHPVYVTLPRRWDE